MAQSAAATIAGPRLVVSRAITQADNGTTVAAVEVPAYAYVPPYGVTVYIAEAVTGGTPTIDVGDGDNDDAWVDNTDVTEGTIGCYTGDGGHAVYSVAGKLYTSRDTIDVVLADAATNGTFYILVTYWDMSNRDVAAA